MFDPLTELMPSSHKPHDAPLNRPARVETTPTQDARRAKLELRMAAVLRGAAKAYGYDAAELWLLDDATRRLTRHTAWGVVAEKTPPVRTLEEADADVAALAGGAVVLENREATRDWPLPHPATSAVCLPVASDLTIHGVVWFYGANERDLDDRELEMLEIVAGRLAMEIEREQLMR